MSWFKKLYGREPGQQQSAYPPLLIGEGQSVEVEFLEDHPRLVTLQFGQRAVINVMYNNEPYSLWLSRVGLANAVAMLESQVESLKGKRARIECSGKGGRSFHYKAEWVSKAPAERQQKNG